MILSEFNIIILKFYKFKLKIRLKLLQNNLIKLEIYYYKLIKYFKKI